jgi:hypothetical protein
MGALATNGSSDLVLILLVIAFVGLFAAAWFTHMFWFVKALGAEIAKPWGDRFRGAQLVPMVGICGLFIPIIGVVHGVMIWLGRGMGAGRGKRP